MMKKFGELKPGDVFIDPKEHLFYSNRKPLISVVELKRPGIILGQNPSNLSYFIYTCDENQKVEIVNKKKA